MLKRSTDIIGAILGIIVFSPIFIFVAVIIWCVLGRPIFFFHDRPGLNEKIFRLIKFRTMLIAFDPLGNPLPDSERQTRLGQFLRSSSLDELPELLNVLKGDMSIVGPRPLLKEYLLLYTRRQSLRHKVRPGITGLAQVCGRNAISWRKKFALDLYYVKNQTFWLDLKIICITVGIVLKREGITSENNVTVSKFRGKSE